MSLILLTALLLSPAPETGTVYGTVRTADTLEPVTHASVRLPDLERGASTDARGYYVLPDVPAGRHRLVVGALGHEPYETEVEVSAGGSVRLDVAISVRPVQIEGVGVRGEAVGGHSEAGPRPARITGASIRAAPGLVEADVLRAVQTLPSVSVASDFSSALYMRGGSPDQTAVTLDGVPVFNPYHLGGLFGAVDPDIVAGVEVWPGAVPASGEDRISGAVAIRTREGGRDRVRGQGGLGLISSRLSMDGPLPGDGGSFLVSFRRTYLDLFTDALYRLGATEVTLPYSFTDLYMKASQDVGEAGSLTVSSYVDTERFHFPERMVEEFGSRMDFTWGTRLGSIAYRHLLTPVLVGEVRVAATTFRGDFESAQRALNGWAADGEFEPVFSSRSRVHDVFGTADLTWHAARHRLRAGGRIDVYRFDHRLAFALDADDVPLPEFDLTRRVTTAAAYLEDEWSPGDAWHLRAGVRVLHAGDRGTAVMPRVGARWNVTDRVALSAGAGRYAQVVQSLKDEEAPGASVLAYDLPAAVETALGLSESTDVVLGVEWLDGPTALRIDGYARWLDGIPLPPAPRGDLLDIPMLVPEGFRPASGAARGLELSVSHGWGDARLDAAYALARSERRVEGERFPPRFERRHTLDLQATLPAGWWGRWSTRFQLASGQPYTPILGAGWFGPYDPVDGTFYETGAWSFVVGDHNSARLPGYSRLDAGGRWELRRDWFGREVTIVPHVNVLNVLNTRNVLVAVPTRGHGSPPVLNYAPQLPFFPSIGVDFSW